MTNQTKTQSPNQQEQAKVAKVISDYLTANTVYRELKFLELCLRQAPFDSETAKQKNERQIDIAILAIASELMIEPVKSSLSNLNKLHLEVGKRGFVSATRDLLLYDMDFHKFIKTNDGGVDSLALLLRSPKLPSSVLCWSVPHSLKYGFAMMRQQIFAKFVAQDIVQSYFVRNRSAQSSQASPDYQRYQPLLDKLLHGTTPIDFGKPDWIERLILKAARRSVAKVTGATHSSAHCQQ